MQRQAILGNQLVASILQNEIDKKALQFQDSLTKIQCEAIEKMQYANTALTNSINCIDNVREFVSSPQNILGSMRTKHGEIAEHIEVEIRNGRSILNGLKPNATFDNVGRLAPEDYLIEGQFIQSKFINGAKNGLNHIIDHLDKYSDFANNGYYHIPKDQYELINKAINGEAISDLSNRSINSLRETVLKIEALTNKPFSEVVKPGISNYNEVQLGKVDTTLDGYERQFYKISRTQKEQIRGDERAKSLAAQDILKPSVSEALKFTAVGAVISGTFSSALKIYQIIKNGKSISDFTLEDWKSVGYDFVSNGTKGGVSGFGIYVLTKVGGYSAPFAGAFVSASVGGFSLFQNYSKNNISKQEFCDSLNALAVESALAAIGASVGQVVIPIPVLGALIGTLTARASYEIAGMICENSEKELLIQMQLQYEKIIKKLDLETKIIVQEIDNYFTKLDGYISAAMSKESATCFYGSIDLCRFLNVPENKIIKNMDELDDFMLR